MTAKHTPEKLCITWGVIFSQNESVYFHFIFLFAETMLLHPLNNFSLRGFLKCF